MEKTIKETNVKGITLIALVITIIVLLILAGISISMLSGNNSILQRATDAKSISGKNGEEEQVKLAYLAAVTDKLGKTIIASDLQRELNSIVGANKTEVTDDVNNSFNVWFRDSDNNYNISNGIVTKVEESNINPIKSAYIKTDGTAIVLKDTGELCKFSYDGADDIKYVEYNAGQETQIATGVRELCGNDGVGDYYITNSNELYYYDGNTASLGDNDVKEFEGYDGIMLTTSDELYYYEWNEGTSSREKHKISDNVEKYYKGGYYITKSKDLCYFDDNTKTSSTISNNVRVFYNIEESIYYITTTNDLKYYNKNSQESTNISSNVKMLCDDGSSFVTLEGELFERTDTPKKITNNVKEVLGCFGNKYFYINTSNELCYYDYGTEKSITITSIKEYLGHGYSNIMYRDTVFYLNSSNELCYYDYWDTNSPVVIESGVKRAGEGAIWYETNNKKIYLYIGMIVT